MPIDENLAAAQPSPLPEAAAKTDAPVVAPAPVEASVAHDVAPAPQETPVKNETVLAQDDAPEVSDSGQPKEAVADKEKSVEALSDEPAQLPTYGEFKLPDGFTHDEAALGTFTKALGEFQIAHKLPQEAMQAFGQQLMDKYVENLQSTVTKTADAQKAHLAQMKSEWRQQFEKDPEIGGNRMKTTAKSALSAISLAGDKKQQTEFKQLMEETGLGNHPAVIRTLAKLNDKIMAMKDKYETEKSVPVVATKPPPAPKRTSDKMYGSLSQ